MFRSSLHRAPSAPLASSSRPTSRGPTGATTLTPRPRRSLLRVEAAVALIVASVTISCGGNRQDDTAFCTQWVSVNARLSSASVTNSEAARRRAELDAQNLTDASKASGDARLQGYFTD